MSRRPVICGIYKVTNKLNGKIYIGQSVDIYKRWVSHVNSSKYKDSPAYYLALATAIRTYGEENFDFSILLQCSREELNEQERKFIEQYHSDNPEYGYNDRQREYRFPDCNKIKTIIGLLENSGLFMDEIATKCNQSPDTVRKINIGKTYHQDGLDYPIRAKENRDIIHRMRYKDCRPSVDFRAIHSAIESYEEYKRICDQRREEGEKIPLLFDEDIDINFVDEILSTSLPAVAEKYNYADATRVQNHLRQVGLPHTLPKLKAYYEEHTGRPHSSSGVVKRKSKNTRPRISRAVAQYDGETRELLNVFLTTSDAAHTLGLNISGINSSAQARGRFICCGGYLWRMIDIEEQLIHPLEYQEYYDTHLRTCSYCGAEISIKQQDECCDICLAIKENTNGIDQLYEKEWALFCLARSNYNALGAIYNLSASAIKARCQKSGITPEEIESARAAVKQQRLDELRAKLPKILPEDM